MANEVGLTLSLLVDQKDCRVTNVEINGQSGMQAIEILKEGLVGFTDGAKRLEISGTWPVFIEGLEKPIPDWIEEGSYHECQIPVGPTNLISKGRFDTFRLGQSTNANTEMSATFIGTFTKMK